jgi:glycosyltransferase involved in cell wall biosynthesis
VIRALSDLRVLIVHDWIVAWGGAERTLAEMLILFPNADLRVGILGEGRQDLNATTRRARETWLGRLPFARTRHRWLLPLYPAAFRSIDTSGYDLVISSAHAFAKTVRVSPATPHLCYCYSPPRYLYDLEDTYAEASSIIGGVLRMGGPVLRRIDRRSAACVDRFVGISHYIAERIRRCYGRDAGVVYPPVSPKVHSLTRSVRGTELLSLGRLVPYKRVDLAIQAANLLQQPLVVAGDGPERGRLERMAGPTVRFLGEVTEERAGELMETCRLMLFNAEEDFGIAPVEANAHGLPVVAYGRGAARETMVDGESVEFFDEPTPESLATAVQRALGRDWDDATVRANGTRFSPERFRRGLESEVSELLAARDRAS